MKWFIYMVFCVPSVLSLYPKESLTREVKTLDGIWNFRICSQDDQDIGFQEKWYSQPLVKTGDVIPMPVPSSFNDITQNKTIRDYLGWAWYDTSFYVPQRWNKNSDIILRFASAHYYAQVYLNGKMVMNHTGGHLPFESSVTEFLDYSKINILTVALNNTLSASTLPQGSKNFFSSKAGPYPKGYYQQETNFDFFNYAGIHRSVVLYAVPSTHIEDILIDYDLFLGKIPKANLMYNISISGDIPVSCDVLLLDKSGTEVASSKQCSGSMAVKNINLWWPFTMHPEPGYLYSLQVSLIAKNGILDIYQERLGFRNVTIQNYGFLVNDKPFYFTGFGKHEDTNIRGKGLDIPLILKDYNLIKWIGANSFRTSHYPYSEEMMDQADEQGIVVIDECPAVGLTSFTQPLFELHTNALLELINRDKNRPSVFAWSIANEPKSRAGPAATYFQAIVNFVKDRDPTHRYITAALNVDPKSDVLGRLLDFVMMNHYYSWYEDVGSTEVIYPFLVNLIETAFQIYKKPIMMSEYGADTIAGLHTDPAFIFTEDYQVEMLIQHHKAFDKLKQNGYFVGEHIWNFADFLTLPSIQRVVGNKKGIFTRERQPKASARVLRCRYHFLANKTLPSDTGYCPSSIQNDFIKSCGQ